MCALQNTNASHSQLRFGKTPSGALGILLVAFPWLNQDTADELRSRAMEETLKGRQASWCCTGVCLSRRTRGDYRALSSMVTEQVRVGEGGCVC